MNIGRWKWRSLAPSWSLLSSAKVGREDAGRDCQHLLGVEWGGGAQSGKGGGVLEKKE